jgi:glycosyltransferase involved in cell wall biosynthesis
LLRGRNKQAKPSPRIALTGMHHCGAYILEQGAVCFLLFDELPQFETRVKCIRVRNWISRVGSQGSDSQGPLVSVVVPCFNSARTLLRTLQSAHNQTYQNLEIIIVDDGSTDATYEIARKFSATDPRAKVLRQSNSGVAAARNLGISNARGEFIAPLDSDDLWSPYKIEMQLCKIQEDDAIGLVYAWFENINDEDKIIPGGGRSRAEGHVLRDLSALDFIGNGSNPLMRASNLHSIGGYDASLRVQGAEGCEDWKLALQLAETHKFAVVAKILMGYRHSAGNMSDRAATMIKSARLVAGEFSIRHPELAETFHLHIGDRLFGYFVRCVRQRRWREASFLLTELAPYGVLWNLRHTLADLKGMASRAWPSLKRRISGSPGCRIQFTAESLTSEPCVRSGQDRSRFP